MEINLQQVEDETKDWLEYFVEKPRKELDGFALCPFAKLHKSGYYDSWKDADECMDYLEVAKTHVKVHWVV